MHTTAAPKRVLVLADETRTGHELFEAMRQRTDAEATDVLIVAPALTSRLRYWLSDEDPGIAAAGRRLAVSIVRCAAAGVTARGALGDADPLQALDDAIRTFGPGEVIVATHPEGLSNWLEHGLVAQARERFDVPITHVEIDAAHEERTPSTRNRSTPSPRRASAIPPETWPCWRSQACWRSSAA